MRWYKIEIEGGPTFDATGDPYALNVEMDIPVTAEHIRMSGAFARVWGIPLKMLLNARQYNNKTIKVYGGMQKGLPLANPAQQGLLVQGTVFPCLGNWVGTDMTIDFVIGPPHGSHDPDQDKAANVIHDWKANTPMKDAVDKALKNAFPKYRPVINISPDLKLPHDDRGFYQTLSQYASYLFRISHGIIASKNYQGVNIVQDRNLLIVSDNTQQAPKGGVINFQDLIGQPIWTGVNTIQFKTVMRGDIKVNDKVTLPKTLAILTVEAGTAVGGNASNIISGQFTVLKIRHTGNFRQPDWPSWASTFDAVQQ